MEDSISETQGVIGLKTLPQTSRVHDFSYILFTPGWSPAYLFEVVFVKCVCIRRTSVFFKFYGVLSVVIYNYSPPTFFLLLFKVTLLQQRTVILVT